MVQLRCVGGAPNSWSADYPSTGAPIASDVGGENLSGAQAPGYSTGPSLAFDGTNYLLVWQTFTSLIMARVDPSTATPLPMDSAGITLDVGGQNAALAYSHGVFLAVWEDYQNDPSTTDIYGALIDASGPTLRIVSAADIPIAVAPGNQASPAVVDTGDGFNFQVVWQDGRNGTSAIYGSLVGYDGTVRDPQGIAITTDATDAPPARAPCRMERGNRSWCIPRSIRRCKGRGRAASSSAAAKRSDRHAWPTATARPAGAPTASAVEVGAREHVQHAANAWHLQPGRKRRRPRHVQPRQERLELQWVRRLPTRRRATLHVRSIVRQRVLGRRDLLRHGLQRRMLHMHRGRPRRDMRSAPRRLHRVMHAFAVRRQRARLPRRLWIGRGLLERILLQQRWDMRGLQGARIGLRRSQRVAGGACHECATSHCVDGYCCNQACEEQCNACDAENELGTCYPILGKPHGSRTGPACLPSATCSNAQTLVSTSSAAVNCSPFKCAGAACLTVCHSVDDCAPPYVCGAAGSCVVPSAATSSPGGCGCRMARRACLCRGAFGVGSRSSAWLANAANRGSPAIASVRAMMRRGTGLVLATGAAMWLGCAPPSADPSTGDSGASPPLPHTDRRVAFARQADRLRSDRSPRALLFPG